MVSATELQSNKSAALVWIFNAIFLGAGNVYAGGWKSSKFLWFGAFFWFVSGKAFSNLASSAVGLWFLLYLGLSIYGVIQVSTANNSLNKKKLFGYMTDVSSVDKNKSLQATNLSDRSPYATAQFEAKLKAADRNKKPPTEAYAKEAISMVKPSYGNSQSSYSSDYGTNTQLEAMPYNPETSGLWQGTNSSGINAGNYMEEKNLASYMVPSYESAYETACESASNTVPSDTIQDRPLESFADTLQLRGRDPARVEPVGVQSVNMPAATISSAPQVLSMATASPPPLPLANSTESETSCTRCGQARENSFSFCMGCGHSYGIG